MKAHIMCSVDSSLAEAAREKKINISNVLNTALTKELEVDLSNDPEIKEKKLLEMKENALKEAENHQKIAENCQKELENMENEKILYAEKMKNEAILRAEEYKKKISREISYFPLFKKQKVLSTPMKREAFFRKRAKIIGLDYEDYLTEIVPEGEKLQVM